MAVSDKQRANETTFNEAFVSRKRDSDTIGRITLKSDTADSGSHVNNVQTELNSIASFLGKAINGAKNMLPTWLSIRRGGESLSVKAKIEAIDAAFAGAAADGGHSHTGEEGEGAKINSRNVLVDDDGLPWVDVHEAIVAQQAGIDEIGSTLLTKAGAGANADITSMAALSGGLAAPTYIDVLQDLTDKAAPGSGFIRIYAKSDGPYMRIGTGSPKKIGSGGGGGGGGSLQWIETDTAPVPSPEFGMLIYSFGKGLGQRLSTLIRVPQSYDPGATIKILLACYSAATAKGAIFNGTVELYRPGTHTLGSGPYDLVASNGISFDAGTVNKLQAVTMTLAASGIVGGVAVQPGDYLRLLFSRGTAVPDADEDVKVPVYGAEVLFQ